jgi:hypothetical protein
MQFKIVGTHQHRAVVGTSTFLCVGRHTPSDAAIVMLWIVCRNDAVLKDDCRTLNEAKNLCRQVSAEELSVHNQAATPAAEKLTPLRHQLAS